MWMNKNMYANNLLQLKVIVSALRLRTSCQMPWKLTNLIQPFSMQVAFVVWHLIPLLAPAKVENLSWAFGIAYAVYSYWWHCVSIIHKSDVIMFINRIFYNVLVYKVECVTIALWNYSYTTETSEIPSFRKSD